ncbi:MAG: hypothetical protein GTN62_15155 [Gemmatimonadales bacterium]|nr:hypothetical protein [Gemmatimonadales bacterium]NIN13149.1 hypothetical protein [Gemmatimonadales bacterium]NIN51427.1 hypothetical protein [Gemmatimonadales bacterium]NIP08891.1 hypothetical protein [Gemmatimonadales bacterium]NIR03679.1 hypothetical protein [Gemmatimonadales bacterium]
MWRRSSTGIALVAGGVGVQACAAALWPVDTAVEPGFAQAEVRSIAVLPFFDWNLSIEEIRAATARITRVIEERNPDLRIVDPAEASDIIGAEGLAYDWALFLWDRRQGAAADHTVVMRAGDALGVDVLLQVELLEASQFDGSAEYGDAVTNVVVQVSLFDSADGGVQWTGTCGIEYADSYTPYRAPSVRNAARWALNSILDALPQLGAGQ